MKTIRKGISFLLASIMSLSVCTTSIYAAEENDFNLEFYANAYPEIVQEVGNDSTALSNQYESIGKSEHLSANLKEAIENRDLYALLNYVLYKTKDEYLQHGLEDNWLYFSASSYITCYPDVSNGSKQTALDHYLSKGMLTGYSSCTSFDPIVALVYYPESLLNVLSDTKLEKGGITLDDIYKAWTYKTGLTSTTGYEIAAIKMGDRIVLVPVSNMKQQSSLIDTKTEQATDQKSSEEESKEEKEKRKNINGLAVEINPYKLYLDTSSSTVQTSSLVEDKVNLTYYGNNLETAQSLAKDKNYTMIIYSCASDQDSNYYGRVSTQILSMLQADLSNVNVLLCVGGAESNVEYCSTYLKNGNTTTQGLMNQGFGIYYLNPDGLDTTTKQALSSFDYNTDLSNEKLEATVNSLLYDGYKGITFDSVINSSTLIPLCSTTSISMGDASLFAGALNFCTDLFSADNYSLCISNHGGGLFDGICSSSQGNYLDGSYFSSDTLTVDELEEALDKTIFSEKKLGFLFLDACLMSSMELGYNLSDFYEYLLASEEVTVNSTNYCSLLNVINDSVNQIDTKTLALDIYDSYLQSSWHTSNVGRTAQTISVYDSDGITKITKKVNDVGSLLNSYFQKYSEDENFVTFYKALRTSMMSCYDFNDTDYCQYAEMEIKVDVGEFFNYLKENLTPLLADNDLNAEQKSLIQDMISSINETLNVPFICASNIEIYGNNVSNLKSTSSLLTLSDVQTSSEWIALRGENALPAGLSLFLPLMGILNVNTYKSYYENSGLSEYVSFLTKYCDYYQNVYFSKLSSLVLQLTADKLNAVIGVEGSQMLKVNDGAHILQFKVADSYESVGQSAPENTCGSPMLDIMESMIYLYTMTLYNQNVSWTNNEGDSLSKALDILCSITSVSKKDGSVDTNSINIEAEAIEKSYYYVKDSSNNTISFVLPTAISISDLSDEVIEDLGSSYFVCSFCEGGYKLSEDSQPVHNVYHVIANNEWHGTIVYNNETKKYDWVKDVTFETTINFSSSTLSLADDGLYHKVSTYSLLKDQGYDDTYIQAGYINFGLDKTDLNDNLDKTAYALTVDQETTSYIIRYSDSTDTSNEIQNTNSGDEQLMENQNTNERVSCDEEVEQTLEIVEEVQTTEDSLSQQVDQ